MRNLYKYYVFIDKIDDNLKKKLIQFINIKVIIDIDDNSDNDHLKSIIKFSKKNLILQNCLNQKILLRHLKKFFLHRISFQKNGYMNNMTQP